jgi:transcriptional regulator with XRE-family HTH domain
MIIQAELEPKKSSRKQRHGGRMKMRLTTLARAPRGTSSEILIHDLSTGGMLIQTDAGLRSGDVIEVDLPRTGMREAQIAWSSGTYFGCRFQEPIPPATVSAALLKAVPRGLPSGGTRQPEPIDFAARLTASRKEKGWTIEQIAERLKVSRQAVWYWETGQRSPRAAQFAKLAELLGVAQRDLLGGPPEPAPERGSLSIADCKKRVAEALGIPEDKIKFIVEL